MYKKHHFLFFMNQLQNILSIFYFFLTPTINTSCRVEPIPGSIRFKTDKQLYRVKPLPFKFNPNIKFYFADKVIKQKNGYPLKNWRDLYQRRKRRAPILFDNPEDLFEYNVQMLQSEIANPASNKSFEYLKNYMSFNSFFNLCTTMYKQPRFQLIRDLQRIIEFKKNVVDLSSQVVDLIFHVQAETYKCLYNDEAVNDCFNMVRNGIVMALYEMCNIKKLYSF